jgi:nitroreductase
VADGGAGFDLAEVDRLLSTTRAVRRRLDLDRPVELDVVLECLRLAVQAPTAGNEQSWRWLVVTDAGKRAALADLYRAAGLDYLSQAAGSAEHDPQTHRVYESALHLAHVLERVPVHVIPCMTRRVDGRPTGVVASAYGSIIPAAWSFQLALRSRGLGTAWTTLHLFSEAEAAALLGIPDGVTQVALLPVAYTKGTDFRPAARPPVETVTYVDTWGASP